MSPDPNGNSIQKRRCFKNRSLSCCKITRLCPRQPHAFFIGNPASRREPTHVVDAVVRREEIVVSSVAGKGQAKQGQAKPPRSIAFLIHFLYLPSRAVLSFLIVVVVKLRLAGVYKCVRVMHVSSVKRPPLLSLIWPFFPYQIHLQKQTYIFRIVQTHIN